MGWAAWAGGQLLVLVYCDWTAATSDDRGYGIEMAELRDTRKLQQTIKDIFVFRLGCGA